MGELRRVGRHADFDVLEIDLHGHHVVDRIAGSGPPVVLVHGMVNSSRHWQAVAERLAPDALADALHDFIATTEPARLDEAAWQELLRGRSGARRRPRAVA